MNIDQYRPVRGGLICSTGRNGQAGGHCRQGSEKSTPGKIGLSVHAKLLLIDGASLWLLLTGGNWKKRGEE